jgi:membrane-associated phospholipid phosphatase
MDFFIQNGVNWVVAIQSLGTWLKVPMLAFSFLGTENFFLLILPLIYWCIDARLGLQVGFILLTSVHVNSLFKLWFAGPRPYWVSSRVTPYLAEETFGIPSGHAQNSVGVWGMIASGIRKPWAWALAVALAFCIGFSRLYLGVHFPHDVVMGWFLGSILLWLFLRFWVPVEAWLKPKSLNTQVLIALVVSILFIGSGAVSVGRLAGYTLATEWQDNALRAGTLPAPVSIEGFITSAGTFFGLAAGIAWLAARGGYQAEGSTQQRALRFVVGVIGILILWRGLALFLPDNADLISYIFRYLRYSLVGFWVSAGAPWLFFRFKLAQSQM